MEETNKKSWVHRHPFATIIGFVVVLIIIGNAFDGSNNTTPTNISQSTSNSQPTTLAPQNSPAPSPAIRATPSNQIIQTSKPSVTTTPPAPISAATSAPATPTQPPLPPTTRPTVQTSPQTPATWHTVITYSNNVGSKTMPFTMQGSEWRMTYNCSLTNPGFDSSVFGGFIYPINSDIYTETWDYLNCPKTNTSLGYGKTPGQYYLDIRDTNVNYTVTVEDYY